VAVLNVIFFRTGLFYIVPYIHDILQVVEEELLNFGVKISNRARISDAFASLRIEDVQHYTLRVVLPYDSRGDSTVSITYRWFSIATISGRM